MTEAEIEERAIRLFERWESPDKPGLWEYCGERLKACFRLLATLRVV